MASFSESDREGGSDVALEAAQQLRTLQSASLPAPGQVYAWAPLKPHATTPVRVLAVTWIEGQYWVEAVDLRNTTRVVRKNLSAWLISTVLLDEELARAAEANATRRS